MPKPDETMPEEKAAKRVKMLVAFDALPDEAKTKVEQLAEFLATNVPPVAFTPAELSAAYEALEEHQQLRVSRMVRSMGQGQGQGQGPDA